MQISAGGIVSVSNNFTPAGLTVPITHQFFTGVTPSVNFSGYADGTFVFVFISQEPQSGGITVPGGWTTVDQRFDTSGTGAHSIMLSRVKQSGDTSYSFPSPGGPSPSLHFYHMGFPNGTSVAHTAVSDDSGFNTTILYPATPIAISEGDLVMRFGSWNVAAAVSSTPSGHVVPSYQMPPGPPSPYGQTGGTHASAIWELTDQTAGVKAATSHGHSGTNAYSVGFTVTFSP